VGVLTVRNVDDDVIVALKARAKANHRSLEGELRFLLGRYAVPNSDLGLVRERARMAAAYDATPTARNSATDTSGQADDTCVDARPDSEVWMGAMRDVGEIVGDIVSPAAEPSDWEALRPEMSRPQDDQTRDDQPR
jgi:plasmid stability protein